MSNHSNQIYQVHCHPGNVYKNKRVLLEAIHAKKTEKMKEMRPRKNASNFGA